MDNQTPNKDTLSSWTLQPTTLWSARLDINGANLNGSPFTIVYKFLDGGETTCPNTIMAGSEGNGSYQTGTCAVTVGTAMSSGTLPSSFQSSGGTYVNDGTTLKICRFGTSGCQEYL